MTRCFHGTNMNKIAQKVLAMDETSTAVIQMRMRQQPHRYAHLDFNHTTTDQIFFYRYLKVVFRLMICV